MAKYLDATGVSTLWSKVKDYGTATAGAAVTTAVNTITKTKGQASGIASLDANGRVPLSQLGNLDTTFAEVVTELPTSGIKKHLYLLKSSSTTTQNLYSEYIYTGDTTATYDASKWEKLGEYKADVDLSGYAKKLEVGSTLNASYDSITKTYRIFLKSFNGSTLAVGDIEPATTSSGGIMSLTDKYKLDHIEEYVNNYSLPAASTSTLGGIKVGANLGITSTGVLSGTPDTHYSSKNVVANSANGTSNGSTTGTVYLNHVENTGLTSSHAIKSGNNVLVSSDTSGNITIAANDTTYSDATTSAHGLMTAADKAKLNTIETSANYYVLPHASSTVLGGVKIGNKMTIDENGVLSTTAEENQNAFNSVTVKSGSSTKTINAESKTAKLGITASNLDVVTDVDTSTIGFSLTKDNVTSALGYTPPTKDTHYTSNNVVSDSNTGTTDKAKMYGVYLNHIENGNVTSSHLITGDGDNCMVESDDRGNITIHTVNTHVKGATVAQNSDNVNISISLNDGNSVTATIPAVDANVGAGVLTTEMAEALNDAIIKLANIAEKATADSAITADELTKILV